MKSKLFLTFLIVLILVNSGCFLNNPRDGVYLIPKDYTGDVIIVFDQPDGLTPEVENGLFVYKIPKDGILKVKTKGYTGIANPFYFYAEDNNQRQPIEDIRVTGDRNPKGEPQNKFGNISQSQYENTVYIMNNGGLGSFITKDGIIQFTSFIVGTPKDGEQLYEKMQTRLSNLQHEFLQNS